MANTPSLFGDKFPANNEMLDILKKVNDNLAGSASSGMRRISIKGGRFRKIIGGEQVEVSKASSMNIIIINAASISRTYYAGAYDPEKPMAPTCWSHDTNAPAKEVSSDQKQSSRCADCPQNIKGSGQGQSRACRFSQRMAVCLEGDLDNVYQLSLPATSLFGDSDKGRLPMGAYGRFLREHGTPASAIVTEMYFDEDSETPKLFFKPVRPLDEDELSKVVGMVNKPEVIKCIELTVAQADNVQAIPAPKAKPEVKVEEVSEDVEEPTKVSKKAETKPTEAEDVSQVINEWFDD